METRANYVLIGAFVLLAAAAAMLFTVWISGSPLSREFQTYDVVFEGPVNGLTEGGEVRFNGIKVGEVKRLSLDRQDPNRVIARIRVDAQTPVRVDSVAQLDFLGITGVTFIQILAGTPTVALLTAADGEVPVIRTERTALDQLFSGGQDLLTVSGDTLNKLNEALSEENVIAITAILHNVQTVSAKLAQDGGVVDSANSALKSLDKAAVALTSAAQAVDVAAKSFDSGFTEFAAEANQAIADVGPAVEDARRAMNNINSAVAQINTNLTPTANQALEQMSLAATDLRSLMIRLQGLAGELEQDPSRFVYRQPQPTEGGKQ
jgi:phospholipid/cholesterol/gamma-HCH transport system substrate-binding protein